MGDEDDWFRLRLAFLRERAVHNGADKDYVALVRQLIEGQRLYGNAEYLTEAAAKLEQARAKYPNSIAVWEHTVLFDAHYGTEEDLNRSLGVLSRLDPDSSIIRDLGRMTPEGVAKWNQQSSETRLQLLENAGSPDPAVSAAAIAGLQNWARSFPQNSTHVINLSLGLVSAGRAEEARGTALSAAEIEDGSFEDAYNIGVVLAATGDPEGARRYLSMALARSASPDRLALTLEALGSLPAESP
jgi:tetratricopeptide (TPR) repeat protein